MVPVTSSGITSPSDRYDFCLLRAANLGLPKIKIDLRVAQYWVVEMAFPVSFCSL